MPSRTYMPFVWFLVVVITGFICHCYCSKGYGPYCWPVWLRLNVSVLYLALLSFSWSMLGLPGWDLRRLDRTLAGLFSGNQQAYTRCVPLNSKGKRLRWWLVVVVPWSEEGKKYKVATYEISCLYEHQQRSVEKIVLCTVISTSAKKTLEEK